jgi:ATP-binding cassette subfamily B protein RaxB
MTETTTGETRGKLYFGRSRRLPMVFQVEASECGLAVLAMICGYHGSNLELTALRQKFPMSLKGMTLTRLLEVAAALNLPGRAVSLSLDELGKLARPCILHWDFNHFVVLRGVSRRHIVIHDPASGIRRVPVAEVGEHFTGVAVELSKGPSFQPVRRPSPVSVRSLVGNITGLWRSLAQILALAAALELFALLTPQVVQVVVDQVLADNDFKLLTLVGLSYAALIVLQTMISALRTWLVMWLGNTFNVSWVGNVFSHLLRLPQAYFMKRHMGDVVSRFGAISAIQQTLTTQFITVIIDGGMATVTLIIMALYSPLLCAITVAACALYGMSRLLYFRVYQSANLSQLTANALQQTSFLESVRGIQALRLFNKEPMQASRYLNATTHALNTSVAVQRLNLVFGSLNTIIGGAQRVAVLWIGAYLTLEKHFSAGMLIAFIAYADQFMARALGMVDYIIQLRVLRLQGERLADIVMTPVERHTRGTYVGPAPKPTITFDNVSFRYAEGEPWILRNCSFEVAEGELVALVGPSGSGKSTVARLALGLLDPVEGRILIGDLDLKDFGKHALREISGSVMQDDRLFSGSIADNIAFFDDAASPQRVGSAARGAQLEEDILKMPMGYHTLVGDMGSSLSGGQQQRLLLARAIYRNPAILLLDEATSHLDAPRESMVNAHIRSLGATCLVIAHRRETIDSADRVISLAGGSVGDGAQAPIAISSRVA